MAARKPKTTRSLGLLCLICGKELNDPDEVYLQDGLCLKCFGAIYHFKKVFRTANLRDSACMYLLRRKSD